jgi:hypothetical protein
MLPTIDIAKEYTQYPGGRYEDDGDGNGTTFRVRFLVPALRAAHGKPLLIILDGAAGYPSSFLEEAFGGLVREEGFDPRELKKCLTFRAEQPGFERFVAQIRDYIDNASPRPDA